MNIPASTAPRIAIADLGAVPLYPASWYRFGAVSELQPGPVSKTMLGKQLVAFRTASGQVAVIDGRCAHMHSDLGAGTVIGETLQCPFHQWRFGTDGQCVAIPCSQVIPAAANLASYPTRVRHQQVYFFFGSQPLFELPFYDGVSPDQLTHGPVFYFEVAAPWYMIAINSVDRQHFRVAHDRRLLDDGDIRHTDPFLHQATYRFAIEGRSWSDQLTRWAGGPEVKLDIAEWSGNVVLAHASLRCTETFGMLFLEPRSSTCTQIHGMVLARPARSGVARFLLDPLQLRIRTLLIRKFLQSDVPRLGGSYVSPRTLISDDQAVVDYLRQLCQLPNGGVAG